MTYTNPDLLGYGGQRYVERSRGSGTNRVHHCLNAGLAMTLCCKAKTANNATSMRIAEALPIDAGDEIDLGTKNPPKKPMAYKKVAKKIT